MTRKQRAANRRNAQLSTGPKTEEGKRTSSMNALKSGLDAESQFVLGETREEFAQLQSEHIDHYQPATPEQRYQVDTLIRTEWFLRRFFRVEASLWAYQTQLAERATGVELGEVFTKSSQVFMRLQRRIDAAQKAHKEAKAELDRLTALEQGNAAAPEAGAPLGSRPARGPQPEQTKPETPQMGSFLNSDLDLKESDSLEMMEMKMNLFRAQQLANSGAFDPKEGEK